VPKKTFDLVPKLTETFDLVVRSSAIRSSDQIPSITEGEIKYKNSKRRILKINRKQKERKKERKKEIANEE
jgi:hypothetical protein